MMTRNVMVRTVCVLVQFQTRSMLVHTMLLLLRELACCPMLCLDTRRVQKASFEDVNCVFLCTLADL